MKIELSFTRCFRAEGVRKEDYMKTIVGWATIVALSVLAISISVYVALEIPNEKYAPIISLAGTTANILAVVWFTATLLYQSRQLSEQRQQFALSLDQTKRSSRREALVVADGILRNGERTALSQNPSLTMLSELLPAYLDLKEMKTMLESDDPNEVVDAGKGWLKREGPAATIMNSIYTATKVYADSTGDLSFDFTKDVEEFVYIYGPIIWKLPYFQSYQGTAATLSDFMVQFTPGRKAALLAYTIAIGLSTVPEILNKEKVKKDIEIAKQKKYPLPAVVKAFEEFCESTGMGG